MNFSRLKYVLLVLYLHELLVQYLPQDERRTTTDSMLFNNMQSFTASMTCLDPYTKTWRSTGRDPAGVRLSPRESENGVRMGNTGSELALAKERNALG
jgi:hypothetical protein